MEIGPPKNIVDIYLELMFTGQLNSYSALPKRVEQAYAGYELFHFNTEYFAVAQQLGQIDLTQESRDQLEGYQAKGLVYVANSLEVLKEILSSHSRLELTEALIPPSTVQCGDAQEKITEFLADESMKDRCQERKSCNPSEHRYGDRRGEILAYLLVADDVVEPTTVRSGARCAIYMKVRYNADIQWPMFGLAIKTVDGQVVHGTNTLMGGVKFLPVIRGQTIIVKFEWEAWLNTSDYFIDLGCAEVCKGESLPVDRRYGVVHLVVGAHVEFSGYVNLRASIMEAHRTVLAPTSSGRLPDICI